MNLKRIFFLIIKKVSITRKALIFIKYFDEFELKVVTISILGVIFYTFCIYLSLYYDFVILKKIANLQ